MSPDEEIDEPQEDPEERRLRELQEAEDAETFGMEGIARTGDVSTEETNATNRKLVWTCVIVGVISIALVACISVSVVMYIQWSEKPGTKDEIAAKQKPQVPIREMPAKIKMIDRDKSTIQLLVPPAIKRTFAVTPETDFLDAVGLRLPAGFNAAEVRLEQEVVIMPTEDGKGLQWLKLKK